MYQDNSLWAASRLKRNLSLGQKKREEKRERERDKMQSLVDRRNLAAYYRTNYGICVNSNDVERLTEKQLLIKLETRHQLMMEHWSAVKIQANVRRFICMN